MTVSLRPLLAAALLALTASASLAQAPAPAAPAPSSPAPTAPAEAKSDDHARLAACRADIAKLCPDAKGGKRSACLKNNTASLSPDCATAYADVEAKAKAMREACTEDVKTLCKGEKNKSKCLRTNEAKLSPACNAAVLARFGKS